VTSFSSTRVCPGDNFPPSAIVGSLCCFRAGHFGVTVQIRTADVPHFGFFFSMSESSVPFASLEGTPCSFGTPLVTSLSRGRTGRWRFPLFRLSAWTYDVLLPHFRLSLPFLGFPHTYRRLFFTFDCIFSPPAFTIASGCLVLPVLLLSLRVLVWGFWSSY